MTLPPKVLALLAFYTRWLERAAPKRVRELIEIGVEVHRDLERQLKKLKPGKFTTTQTAEVLVQTRTLLEAAAEKYGEQMGDVLQAIHVDGAKRGREALEKQIEAWEAEGLLPPRPADSSSGPTDAGQSGSSSGPADPPPVDPPTPPSGGGGGGGGSSRGRKVKPELVAELLDPGLLELQEASRKAYGEELIAKMRRSLARGVLANETIAQTTERMAAEFEMPAWRAERIVRTEQSFAFHRRQILDLIDEWGDEAEERFRKQLLAVRDDRTGDDSKFVDGQTRHILDEFEDNKERRYQHPPNRPNDREKMVFIPFTPSPVHEVRKFYHDEIDKIPAAVEAARKDGASLEEQARLAARIRHDARVAARAMMKPKDVIPLRKRDLIKYRNPDGPTFDWLLENERASGHSDDAAFRNIIESSGRTDESYNEQAKKRRD